LLALDDLAGPGDYMASFVVDCRTSAFVESRTAPVSFRSQLTWALEKVIPTLSMHHHGVLAKLHLINVPEEILLSIPIPGSTFEKTELHTDPEVLAGALKVQVPKLSTFPDSRIAAKSLKGDSALTESFVPQEKGSQIHGNNFHVRSTAEQEIPMDQANEKDAMNEEHNRLVYSDVIGKPSYVLDPKWLVGCQNLCPNKMAARLVLSDANTVVKYGHGVRLAEAEAMHFVNANTTIAIPSLDVAYELDGIGS
jgi:hypothetical protein